MKKLLLTLALVASLCAYVYAADPAYQDGNRVHFTAESQQTTTPFLITSIVWGSASGDEVGGTGGFILQDINGNFIAGMDATALSDHLVIPIPGGIRVRRRSKVDVQRYSACASRSWLRKPHAVVTRKNSSAA